MSFSHCFPCCLVISRLVNLLHRQNKLPIISFFTQDKIEKKWVVAIDNTNNNTDNMDNVDNMDNMENTEQKKKIQLNSIYHYHLSTGTIIFYLVVYRRISNDSMFLSM
jgi:hypothetical protein